MAISGNRTPSMFQRYNITSAEDKLVALNWRASYLENGRERANVVGFRAPDSDKLSDR